MALQGVRDYGHVQPGQKVLINGAGGGVGTLAIQMAKAYGAYVTAVNSTQKHELMRQIEAYHVVDYTIEDFAKAGLHYDVVLDVTAHRSMFDCKRVLSPTGRYFMIGGETKRILQLLVFWAWLRLTGSKQKMAILTHQPNKNLSILRELFETNQVVPVIDGVYPLSDTASALKRLGEGRVLGKVVVTL